MNGPAPPNRGFKLSVIRNTAPDGKLCKTLQYDGAAERVVNRASALLFQGSVTSVSFSSIREFMDFRGELAQNQALMMGQAIYPDAQIVTQDQLGRIPREKRRADHIIARDREHVAWAEGPALVMLDLDRPDEFPAEVQGLVPTTPDKWRDLLITLVPGLEDVPMAWAPSSSSYIYRNEDELHGLRGQRFYFVIESGLDTPRFADALHDALVLQGLAWFAVSKSGSRLERLPFDFAVFRPEHLDFAAPPHCEPPLEWRGPDPIIWNKDGACLSASDIPETSEADGARVEAALRARRQVVAEEARAVRQKWIEDTGRQIALRNDTDRATGTRAASAAVELGVLLPDFVLTDSDGSVTVGELLDDPAQHHGRRFYDPLEPDYRDDPRIAVFLVSRNSELRYKSITHRGPVRCAGRSERCWRGSRRRS